MGLATGDCEVVGRSWRNEASASSDFRGATRMEMSAQEDVEAGWRRSAVCEEDKCV